MNPDIFLGRCERCDDYIFRMVHHYTKTIATFDPVPWTSPPPPDPEGTKLQRERQLRDYDRWRKTALFVYSLALLDFDHGTYSLAQPLARSKPRRGTYFIPHAINCAS